MFTILFAAMILIGHAPYATCYTDADVKALKKKLFITNEYDRTIRPAVDQSSATVIRVQVFLLNINELNEAKETMKTSAFLILHWNDEFLRWNTTDHNGIDEAYWPQNDVWRPDIALRNSNLEHKELGVSSLYVRNQFDGTMYWPPFQVFESKCSMDITNFPFDIQTCYLQFQAWSYPIKEVGLLCGSRFDGADMSVYEPNPGWDILSSRCTVWAYLDLNKISYSITIRRKPLYFMLSVIFPILTLSILNICVFLLPTDSGEKAGYSITVFLAFAVFLTIVSSSLPQNSNSVALIAVFLIIQTICSTLTTFFALALLRMSSFDEKVTIPRILVFLMRCLKCKSCSKAPRIVQNEICATGNDMSDRTSTGDVEFSWKEVVNFLDVMLFVIFACILVASSLGCFLTAMNFKPSDLQTDRPTPDGWTE